MNYHPTETETDCRICLCFTCPPETNFPVGLWRVLGQQPQASTLVGPSRQRGVELHRAGGAEQVTLQRRVVSQEVSAHSHTHTQGTSNAFRFAGVRGLSEEREAHPHFGCAIYLTICSDAPGRCQIWK